MNDDLRKWLGDYIANLNSSLGPEQAYAMPSPQNAPAYNMPQRQAPPVQLPVQPQIEQLQQPRPQVRQQQRVQAPEVTGSLSVPLNTGELFARGMFAPQEQRPLQGFGFGYRMNF